MSGSAIKRIKRDVDKRMAARDDALLAKHELSLHGLIGFASGVRCVCSLMPPDERPCISCKARAFRDEFRALVAGTTAR